jgi:hypothetical protein
VPYSVGLKWRNGDSGIDIGPDGEIILKWTLIMT